MDLRRLLLGLLLLADALAIVVVGFQEARGLVALFFVAAFILDILYMFMRSMFG